MKYLKNIDFKWKETYLPLGIAWISSVFIFFFFLKIGLDAKTFSAAFPVFGVILPFMRVYRFPKPAVLISFIIGYVIFNQSFSPVVLLQGIVGAIETFILFSILEVSAEKKYSFLIHRSLVALVAAGFGLCYGLYFFLSKEIFTDDITYSIAGIAIIHVVSAIVVAPFIRQNLIAMREKSWIQLYLMPIDVWILIAALSSLFFLAQAGIQYIFLVMLAYGYFSLRCKKEQLFVINFIFTVVISVISDELWGPFVGATPVQSMFSGGLIITAIVMVSFAFYEVIEVNLPKKAYLFFLGIIALFSGISYSVNHQEYINYFKHMDTLVEATEDDFADRIENSRMLSKALGGFWLGSQKIDEDEWQKFGHSLELKEVQSGVHAVGLFTRSVQNGKSYFTIEKMFSTHHQNIHGDYKNIPEDSIFSFLNKRFNGECFFLTEKLSSAKNIEVYSFVAIEFAPFFGGLEKLSKGQITYDVSLSQSGHEEVGYVFQKEPNSTLSANKIEVHRRISLADESFLMHYFVTQKFDSGAFLIFWRTSLLFTLVCILFGKVIIETMKTREQLHAQAEELSLKLMQSSRQAAIGEMASGIAHEVNNPLSIISLTAQKLLSLSKKGLLTTNNIQTDLEKLVKTADRISKIIKGLKALGRNAEADPKAEVSMSQIINDSLEVCLERFRHNNVEIEVKLDSRRMVMGRSAQLSQVIINLLNNSFDAIVEKRKDNEHLWVRVECLDRKDRIEVSVTDSGLGIPVAVREKMFQPFFTTKGVGKGTGIGLEISRRIIADHEGELKYDDSSPNTRFVFSLPVAQVKPQESIQKAGFSTIEVLIALAIVVATVLAGVSLSANIMTASKKTKAVALAIQIENTLLESVNDPLQVGFNGVRQKLKDGIPPDSILLQSSVSASQDTGQFSVENFYLLNRNKTSSGAVVPPNVLYLNEDGKIVSQLDEWVVRLRASYRMKSHLADNLPQYDIAYAIEVNPIVADMATLGATQLPATGGSFSDEDYVFPLSQSVYSGFSKAYADQDHFGTCVVNDQARIISLYSVDLVTGESICVLKGNECAADEISVGFELNPTNPSSSDYPHLRIDLKCKPIHKCACGPELGGGFNWVVSEFTPIQLIEDSGTNCGSCQFIYKDNISRPSGPNIPSCPSQFYQIQGTCVYTRNTFTTPAPTAANPNPDCTVFHDSSSVTSPIVSLNGGRGDCIAPSAGSCESYTFERVENVTCQLEAANKGRRDAKNK